MALSHPASPAPSLRAASLALYGVAALIGVGVPFVQGRSAIETAAWLPLPTPLDHVLSVLLGAGLAAITVGATRRIVRSWRSAKALHALLRPAIHGAGEGTIVLLGLASAIGEELLFRGVLTTTFGLVVSSLAFGLLHQVRGEARWLWAGWATMMGVLFGALFLATGSLLGPIVAHAAINIANLRFLRDTDVEEPKPRRLGGLL